MFTIWISLQLLDLDYVTHRQSIRRFAKWHRYIEYAINNMINLTHELIDLIQSLKID